jgi:hypothetical protein
MEGEQVMPLHGIGKHENWRLKQKEGKWTLAEIGDHFLEIARHKKKKEGLKSPMKEQYKGGKLTKDTVEAMEEYNKRINDLIKKGTK